MKTVIQYTFEKVPLTVTRTGKCTVCGKRAQRAATFYQTINPYNKDKDGNPKSYGVIYRELRVKADAWRKTPLMHARCAP